MLSCIRRYLQICHYEVPVIGQTLTSTRSLIESNFSFFLFLFIYKKTICFENRKSVGKSTACTTFYMYRFNAVKIIQNRRRKKTERVDTCTYVILLNRERVKKLGECVNFLTNDICM